MIWNKQTIANQFLDELRRHLYISYFFTCVIEGKWAIKCQRIKRKRHSQSRKMLNYNWWHQSISGFLLGDETSFEINKILSGAKPFRNSYFHKLIYICISMQTDTFWLCNVQKKDVILENISYNCFKYTVVKWGHTEGIEREKTSSQNSQGIALDFWTLFSHSNLRVEYNWRAIPAEYKCPHILI